MPTLNTQQRTFLEAPRYGALATVEPDGAPQLTVMWYALDGDEVMFNTARERRKPSNLARDPRVSLIVFDAYTFLRVTGRAREAATGEAALEDIHGLAVRYGGVESAARGMELFRTQERVSYRFRIEKVYASADLR